MNAYEVVTRALRILGGPGSGNFGHGGRPGEVGGSSSGDGSGPSTREQLGKISIREGEIEREIAALVVEGKAEKIGALKKEQAALIDKRFKLLHPGESDVTPLKPVAPGSSDSASAPHSSDPANDPQSSLDFHNESLRGEYMAKDMPTQTRVTEREAKLTVSETEVDMQELGGGVSNGVSTVRLSDGSRGVFKPSSGESEDVDRPGIAYGQMTERECAAWDVAKIVELDDIVAATVPTEIDGESGSLAEFVNGKIAAEVDRTKMYDGADNALRAAMFDFVIGNQDRHAGNWMIDNAGGLKLIDHGLAFGESSTIRGNTKFEDNIFSFTKKSSRPFEDFIDKYVKRESSILKSLRERGIPKKAVEQVRRRIQHLKTCKDWSGMRDYGSDES